MAKPVTKVRSVNPTIKTESKTNPHVFDAITNLDKRFSAQLKVATSQTVEQFTKALANSLTEIIFLGYYVDGGYVGVLGNENKFKSPIDKYQYSQKQVKYIWSLFSTRTANATNPDGSPFVMGQLTNPEIAAANSGAGQVFWAKMWVDQNDGSVNTTVSYYVSGGAETITNDGILAVMAICQRSLPK